MVSNSVESLLNSLEGLIRLASEMRRERSHQPATGSVAYQELQTLEPALRGSWHETPVSTALSLADLALAAAADHLVGVVRTFRASDTELSPVTLARSALEALGRGWWILDPQIPGRTRVARGLNEYLYGLWHGKKLGPPLMDEQDVDRTIGKIQDGAVANGFSLLANHRPGSRPPEFNERRPAATQVVESLLQASADAKVGATLFRFYSAVAHATAPGLVSMFLETPGQSGPRRVGAFVLPPFVVGFVLGFSILGFNEAIGRQIELYGWSSGEDFDAYTEEVQTALRMVIAFTKDGD